MFWQEEPNQENFSVSDEVQDCVFTIDAHTLPVDHLNLVANALLKHLPWLIEARASLHDINIADGNGWQSPHETNALFYPSKRSKLNIRLPKQYLEKTNILLGKVLKLDDYSLGICKRQANKKLSDSTIIFAKYVHTNLNDNEEEFLQNAHQKLNAIGIKPKKMMVGLKHTLATNNGTINTRSLMLADLKKEESVYLQANGFGDYRLLGCGLFVPQKGIDAVAPV